jgi:hypothetical protein
MIRVEGQVVRRAIITLVCATALAAVPGCGGGGGDDQSSARDAAQAYVDATNDRDFVRVCELLSNSYKQKLQIAANCPDFLKEQTSGAPPTTLTLVGVQEQGSTASAHIRSHSQDEAAGLIADETALFAKEPDGSWRLAALTSYRAKQ